MSSIADAVFATKKMLRDNTIAPDVVLPHDLVIGTGNVIKSGTVIEPGTVIGNNNVILERNWLGVLPASAYERGNATPKGLVIGNGNFFHVCNKVSSGLERQTAIGDNNTLLGDVYLSHDNVVHNNVTFYPRVFSAGLVEFFSHAAIGAGACIQQHIRVGSYAMVGMNGVATRDVLPGLVCINDHYKRVNTHKIDSHGLQRLSRRMEGHTSSDIIVEDLVVDYLADEPQIADLFKPFLRSTP